MAGAEPFNIRLPGVLGSSFEDSAECARLTTGEGCAAEDDPTKYLEDPMMEAGCCPPPPAGENANDGRALGEPNIESGALDGGTLLDVSFVEIKD